MALLLTGGAAPPIMAGLVAYGVLAGLLVWRRREWTLQMHALSIGLLATLSWFLTRSTHWLILALFIILLVGLFFHVDGLRRRAFRIEAERLQLAQQLDRRINEIFSLQELSYVLAESLQLERIAEQVARYTLRFLQADGAMVALAGDDGESLVVAAAEGSLSHLSGMRVPDDPESLVMQAVTRERIEVAQAAPDSPVLLFGHQYVTSGAAAPLRAHGFTMGALAVTDRRSGPFTPEDLWLLSTVTTHVAVVMANSRLFEMIRQAKEEWETAFNALAEGIAVVDAEGKVLRANRALARMLDLPPTALIGRQFWESVTGQPEEGLAFMTEVRRADRLAPRLVRSETLNRMLRLTAAPLAEPADTTAIVILIEDVTEQQALEAQVIQSEKLAAVGQLVSGVAHELNNPLTSIAGLSEFLLERAQLPPAEREHLRVIHEQAERAGRIVRNLLTFARKGAPESSGVDLNDVVERTTLLMAHEISLRGITLEPRLSAEGVTLLGDRYEMQQVLLNLLTNAIQAVRANGESNGGRIQIETFRDSATVGVRVRDNGPGVPHHLVPHLFTPFFTTKEPGEGTGLGLSISYGIAESHGGRLSYGQAPGGGSEFTIALPYRPLTDGAEAPSDERTPVEPSGRAILLVDDDPSVHRMLAALFARDGHLVESVKSGDHALALAKEREYDLVITEQRITAAPGSPQPFTDALLRLRPTWADRLMLTTTEASTATRLRAEGHRVVQRPFNLREVRDVTEMVLAGGRKPEPGSRKP
jgi:two-component system NtrC family sensor kinase